MAMAPAAALRVVSKSYSSRENEEGAPRSHGWICQSSWSLEGSALRQLRLDHRGHLVGDLAAFLGSFRCDDRDVDTGRFRNANGDSAGTAARDSGVLPPVGFPALDTVTPVHCVIEPLLVAYADPDDSVRVGRRAISVLLESAASGCTNVLADPFREGAVLAQLLCAQEGARIHLG